MSLLKFVVITLFLNAHYDASEGVQKNDIDKRPTYMLQEYGYTMTGSVKTINYGGGVCLLPMSSVSSTDLLGQETELKDYKNLYNSGSAIEFSPNFSIFYVHSRESSKNPPVILWLHGSGGADESDMPVQQILDRGYALVTFDRFNSYVGCTFVSNLTKRENEKSGEGHVGTDSWGAQDSLSLSTEIIMAHKMCVELSKLGSKEFILAGHSRGAILAAACATEDHSEMFEKVGVKGCFALGAMPVQMKPLTNKIPVVFVSGAEDEICPSDLVEYFHKHNLKEQSNVKLKIIEDMAHCPFSVHQITFLGSTINFFGEIFYNPGLWRQAIWNYVNGLNFLLLGTQGLHTTYLLDDAQGFSNACSVVSDDGFRPLIRAGNSFKLGEKRAKSDYPNFIKANVTRGVVQKEPLTTKEKADLTVQKIVDMMCGMITPAAAVV